jgi:hypothetical protein
MEHANDEKVESILKAALIQFESTLIRNSIIDIHSDYFITSNVLKVPSISNVSNENILSLQKKHIFTSPEYQEKIISCIDVNESNGAIAVGLMSHGALDDHILKSNRHDLSNYIYVWAELGTSSSPLRLLCPAECSICKFHPEINDHIVAGCANGQVCLFDLNSKNLHDEVLPTYTGVVEKNHSHMITDIFWLPLHSQIRNIGIDGNNGFGNHTNQFVTVGGGDILIWDIRFQNIRARRKYKQDCDDNIWKPFFQIKPKRLHGSGEISIQKGMYFPDEHLKTKILCVSESGDIICIDVSPDSDLDYESSYLSNQFVKWVVEDKCSGSSCCCEILCPSPFFPKHILYINSWNFQVWNSVNMSDRMAPIFLRPQSTSRITSGCWSPSRPSLLYIGKADGTIDVWEFLLSSFSPSLVISTKNTIMTLNISRNVEDNRYFLIVGDDFGSVYTFLLPEFLTTPLAKEKEMMEILLETETNSQDSIPVSTLSIFDHSVLKKELTEKKICPSEEEESFYNDFCSKICD